MPASIGQAPPWGRYADFSHGWPAWDCSKESSREFIGVVPGKETDGQSAVAMTLHAVGPFTRWLRRLPVDAQLTFNPFASEGTLGLDQHPILPT